MSSNGQSRIPDILKKYKEDILTEWFRAQAGADSSSGRISDAELREQCQRFLNLLQESSSQGTDSLKATAAGSEGMRELLSEVSRSRGLKGFSPSETATFVFSLKQPLFARLRRELGKDSECWPRKPGGPRSCWTSLASIQPRSTRKTAKRSSLASSRRCSSSRRPVVKLWEGILALPLIGTLDSARTQVVMETLLQKIVETGPRSPSSTSPACRPSTRSWRST